MHSLPVFLRLDGRPVILLGEGESAAAKRRLLERAGARIVAEEAEAALAVVALDDPDAAAARLKARGVLVNAVDRPDLCDFTLPAIVERGPVLIAIGTGGVSAGLAAALRQRLEALLPASLGRLAEALHAGRARLRALHPDMGERRRAIAALLAPGGRLDPLVEQEIVELDAGPVEPSRVEEVAIASADPDELTLRTARLLALADRIYHPADMPAALLDRARADAERIAGPAPAAPPPGLTLVLAWSER